MTSPRPQVDHRPSDKNLLRRARPGKARKRPNDDLLGWPALPGGFKVRDMTHESPAPAPHFDPLCGPTPGPDFGSDFQAELDALVRWRRDVRRFKTDPLPDGLMDDLLTLAALAPSVGNSQPWRFVFIESAEKRHAVREHFTVCNAQALNDYEGEQAKLYAQLKLSGMDQAPVQLAVYCDLATQLGHGLGKRTMPETLHYSVVMAVHTLWLAARARGVGMGWVSILEPAQIDRILDVPKDWALVAYLCIGYPQEEHLDPELVRYGWQERVDISAFVSKR